MTKQYTQRDEEFKKMIVNLCETSSDKTMSDIAREYDVSRTNITNWRKKYENYIFNSDSAFFYQNIIQNQF